MTQDIKTPLPPAASGPTASGKRFLVQLMEHAFREGWRTPDDFIKHFPAPVIMAALRSATELRVSILSAATGIYEEILRRKTPSLAAEDLRLALEEGTTNSMQLLAVFSPEDRVRYLDAHRIWDFLAEDRFWQADADASDELRRSAAERMTFTLSQALKERLISIRDILDGLTYDAVADSLSPQELRTVVRYALEKGRDGIGLNEKVLLEVLPLEKLVVSVPLEHTWNEVVIRRLAIPCGLTDLTREERRASQAERRGLTARQAAGLGQRSPSRSSVAPPPPPLPREMRAGIVSEHAVTALPPSGARSDRSFGDSPAVAEHEHPMGHTTAGAVAMRDGSLLPPPPLPATPPSQPASGFGEYSAHPAEASGPAMFAQPQQALVASHQAAAMMHQASGTTELSDQQRRRVTEHLRAIGRLPPSHERLSAHILRSIDAMYALLPSATDDIQRKSVIRQAFANEQALREALLGLIELMDSSVDTTDPVIRAAKIEALIKILLFEEQRRKETGRFPSGATGPSPSSLPSPASGSSSYPAPFAGQSVSHMPGLVSVARPSGHVSTQRPPPPVLTGAPVYPPGAGGPPLPNLPAEGSGRRSMPPPLPPSFQGSNS